MYGNKIIPSSIHVILTISVCFYSAYILKSSKIQKLKIRRSLLAKKKFCSKLLEVKFDKALRKKIFCANIFFYNIKIFALF